jgi:hypothetical protein
LVDSHVQNEGNGWAGSGANPWHLDEDTESILFFTNESDKPARIAAKVAPNGGTYYLTKLQLNPHEVNLSRGGRPKCAHQQQFVLASV